MSPSCVPESYPHDTTPQPADDLLVVTGIARHELFATDASPAAAGACVATITAELWRSLYRIAEEKSEHVRLDWGSTPPPPTFVCTHSSAAALITPEAWTEPFACRFSHKRPHQRARTGRLGLPYPQTLQQGCSASTHFLLRRLKSRTGCSDKGQVSLQKTRPRPAQACLRVPRFLAHHRPAVGAVVGHPGGRAFAALLFGQLAP